MNTTNTMLLAGLIVAIGRWADDKPLTARVFVGLFILTLFVTVIGQSQPKLASRFGLLILVAVTVPPLGYGGTILGKLGYPVAISNPSTLAAKYK